ncbi:MAG: efflux RND transporter periplasmic adaptor subunit [Chitinophagaceae bacterium]|nr:MAG: efflux RND transporter periplasmic adaptor subunit [Chitinophagaceae bacterium]
MKTVASTGSLAILLTLTTLTACGDKKDKNAAAPAPKAAAAAVKVDGFLVTTQAFAENIEVPGSVIANETTVINPEISGRLTYLNVAEGRTVAKGTLLAKLYDADLQAQLKKLEVQLKIAQTNEGRSAQLLKIEGISKADYDASLLNVNTIKADMEIVRTGIVRTEIRAPFSGKLGLKNISPGAYVTPSTIIAVINQVGQLKLDFTVPEKYSAQMKNGKVVHFSYEGSDKLYTAKISATESSVTEATRSLMVRSLIQDSDERLVPGTFAKVRLSFDPDPNAILIPTQAIVPQARGKKIVLYKSGIAKFVDVTTSSRDSARVQVIEGLKAGDTIVTTGLLSVRPDSKIQLNKVVNTDSTGKK